MANTYGRLYGENKSGNSKPVTRTGSERVVSELETWKGRITTILRSNGDYRIEVSDKNGNNGVIVATGNIDNYRIFGGLWR